MKYLFLLLFLCTSFVCSAQSVDTLYIWPNEVPGEILPKQEAKLHENQTGNVIRLTDITNPILIAYHPEERKYDASVLICPGGGYSYLAVNKEGFEIAKWINTLGITAYVLQYRVPDKKTGALQDAQRAIKLIKQANSTHKIGIMGFSAGASLSARASTSFHINTYPSFDQIDELSARPDFAALIYPAYLDLGENKSLTPELTITEETPPMFIFGTSDDQYGNSGLVMTSSLRKNKIPVELHILADGGHGYGMRKGNIAAETWPDLLKKWLLIQLK